MNDNSLFEETYSQIKNNIKRVQLSSEKFEKAMLTESFLETVSISYELQRACESLANKSRSLPILSPCNHSENLKKIEDIIIEENDVFAEYTKEGWFHLHLPTLLPKKKNGTVSNIRAMCKIAIDRFVQTNEVIFPDEKVVIVFQHNYSTHRKEKEYRDHDNIETKCITDILALYFLKDDSPPFANHYYCSRSSIEDSTDIYILKTTDFCDYINRSII